MIIVDNEFNEEVNKFLNGFRHNSSENYRNYMNDLESDTSYIEFIRFLVEKRNLQIKNN